MELTRAGDAALGRWWVPADPEPAAPEPAEPVREMGAAAPSKGATPIIDLLDFPEFHGVSLPVSELPADFSDCSFHEDTAPSMWSARRRVLIWFKHPNPTFRWGSADSRPRAPGERARARIPCAIRKGWVRLPPLPTAEEPPRMNREVIHHAPFVIGPAGIRVLQCHSRGDRRFTPFDCYVAAFGRSDSIENHYHRAKRFGERAPGDWREAKQLKKLFRQTGWQIGPLAVEVRSNPAGSSFRLDDLGIQYYVMLWYRYLRRRPELIAAAAAFDEFEDPFRGAFPFCQDDVIQQVVREGIDSLPPMFAELEAMLRDPVNAAVATRLQSFPLTGGSAP